MAIETASDERTCPKVGLCLECCSVENRCHLQLVTFSIGSPEGHCLPSRSSEFPHTERLCEHLVTVAILPGSVLANPEAEFW